MTRTRTRYARDSKLTYDQLYALPKRNAATFSHPPRDTDRCAVCGEQLGYGGGIRATYGTTEQEAADDQRTGWYHEDHDHSLWVIRKQEAERPAWEREQLKHMLINGGRIALGTDESRQTWEDGVPEVVEAIMHHFTDEERAVLMAGIV